MIEPERIAAFHESGHATAAYALGFEICELTLRRTEVETDGKTPEQCIVVRMAGGIAEHRVTGDCPRLFGDARGIAENALMVYPNDPHAQASLNVTVENWDADQRSQEFILTLWGLMERTPGPGMFESFDGPLASGPI